MSTETKKHEWLPIAIVVVLVLCLVASIGVGGLLLVQQWLTFQPSTILTPVPPATLGRLTPLPITPSAPPGDTLRLPGIGGEPPTLDPALSQDSTSAEYVVEIFSGLVTIDKDLKIVPDIAEKWETSADSTVYTFHLCSNAKFHDGKPVTANDFKYSFERACDPATGSPVADTYLGDIIGCRDKLNGKAKEVSGVKVIDDRTLQITIDAPKTYFLAKLSYPTAFVVDKDNVEKGGATWTDHPNGTGPYKLEKHDLARLIVLARNDDYYGEPKPSIKRVQYLLAGGSIITMYENNELDSVPVSIIDIERVTDPTNPLNKELTIVDIFSISYIGFNTQMPPFDDVKVRQAFNMAVDKKKITEVVLKKMEDPAKGILPPGFPGYSKELEGLPFDPAKAKALITESKYKDVTNLPEITLHISGEAGVAPSTIQAMVQMWKDNLGVEVTIQQTEFATFLTDLNRKPNPYQMFSIGWIADYPDPQDFLDILFHSKSLDNHTSYSNPKVDDLLDKARTEKDETKRIKLYQDAEQIIVNDAAWIPLTFGRDYWLTKPYVKNLIHPPMVIPRLKYASISR
jgi:oligopeptide transport system substrate-binding protein